MVDGKQFRIKTDEGDPVDRQALIDALMHEYKTHRRAMADRIRKSFRYLNNEDVDDILQEVFLRCYKSLMTRDLVASPIRHYKAWIAQALINVTLNAIRGAADEPLPLIFDEDEDERLADARDERPLADEQVAEMQMREAVRRAVRRLKSQSPQQMHCVKLVFINGKTHEQAAGQLGITSGTCKSNVFKAKAKLRLQLEGLLEAA